MTPRNMEEEVLYRHALIVGGSGMLGKASIWLGNRCRQSMLMARTAAPLVALQSQISNCEVLQGDYTDLNSESTLDQYISGNGDFDIILAWIHSTGKDFLQSLPKWLTQSGSLYLVKSSATAKVDIQHHLDAGFNVVQLGFVLTDHGSRWLSHEEISDGVIEAISKRKRHYIVGTIEPWSARP